MTSFGERVWRNKYLRVRILCFRRLWTATVAAWYGAIDIFREIGHEFTDYSGTRRIAVQRGHVEVLQWLLSNGPLGSSRMAIMDQFDRVAAVYGQLRMLQWMHDVEKNVLDRYVLEGAATNGHAHVVEWLMRISPWTQCERHRALDIAVDGGYFPVFRLLHDAACTSRCADMFGQSVARGDADAVVWQREHCGSDICATTKKRKRKNK